MKRLPIAALFCIAAVMGAIAAGGTATPTSVPIVKTLTSGIVMTGQDAGAPLASPSPAQRALPITLGATAIVMTGQDAGVAGANGSPTGHTLPLTLTASPGIVMTGRDAMPRVPLVRIPPSPSPSPTRGIKP